MTASTFILRINVIFQHGNHKIGLPFNQVGLEIIQNNSRQKIQIWNLKQKKHQH
jgi:hypothetical protein